MEALKYAPSWGLRHRRDSVSGLSVHSSQPFGGHYPGISSPAPTYHSQGNLILLFSIVITFYFYLKQVAHTHQALSQTVSNFELISNNSFALIFNNNFK